VRELGVGGVAGRPEGDGVEPGGGKVDIILQPLVLVDHAHLKRDKRIKRAEGTGLDYVELAVRTNREGRSTKVGKLNSMVEVSSIVR
jgi:hypothetical protein